MEILIPFCQYITEETDKIFIKVLNILNKNQYNGGIVYNILKIHRIFKRFFSKFAMFAMLWAIKQTSTNFKELNVQLCSVKLTYT